MMIDIMGNDFEYIVLKLGNLRLHNAKFIMKFENLTLTVKSMIQKLNHKSLKGGNMRKNIWLAALLAMMFIGCGREDHAPTLRCVNFGRHNVRRDIRLRLSLQVDRQPLVGVNDSTVVLTNLSMGSRVAADILYSGERIFITPRATLPQNTDFRLSIRDGIIDDSGKELEARDYDFSTGDKLQVYRVKLLRSYDDELAEIYSIAVVFSENISEACRQWGEGYFTLRDANYFNQFFRITYYDSVAVAVLVFDTPLKPDIEYTLAIGNFVRSEDNLRYLDGNRDGSDMDAYILHFSYKNDLTFGLDINNVIEEAAPYNEGSFGCFLEEYE